MKITRSLPVLVLPFLLGSVAWSAPETAVPPAPESAVKPFPKEGDENYALAKDLLRHGLDAYDAATSFQGAFTLTATVGNKTKKVASTDVQMQTSWRVNERGDKVRENNFLVISGQEKGKRFVQTVHSVDNGQIQIEHMIEEKKWSQVARTPISTFRSLFRPIVDAVANNAINSQTISLIAEQGIEGGVPIYIVRDEEQNSAGNFRVVFNASDRSLRSLQLNTIGGDFKVLIFDCKFNEPLAESVFEWKAPLGVRQVPAGTLKPKMGVFGQKDGK